MEVPAAYHLHALYKARYGIAFNELIRSAGRYKCKERDAEKHILTAHYPTKPGCPRIFDVREGIWGVEFVYWSDYTLDNPPSYPVEKLRDGGWAEDIDWT